GGVRPRRVGRGGEDDQQLARLAEDRATGVAVLTPGVEHGEPGGEARGDVVVEEGPPVVLADGRRPAGGGRSRARCGSKRGRGRPRKPPRKCPRKRPQKRLSKWRRGRRMGRGGTRARRRAGGGAAPSRAGV